MDNPTVSERSGQNPLKYSGLGPARHWITFGLIVVAVVGTYLLGTKYGNGKPDLHLVLVDAIAAFYIGWRLKTKTAKLLAVGSLVLLVVLWQGCSALWNLAHPAARIFVGDNPVFSAYMAPFWFYIMSQPSMRKPPRLFGKAIVADDLPIA